MAAMIARFLALLCITSVTASVTASWLPDRFEEGPAVALALDDLCDGVVDAASACALSARQLRGSAEVTEASREHPELSLQTVTQTASRRRGHSAGAVQDITAAEEAKFTRKLNATRQQLQVVERSLQDLEHFENETGQMATEHPAVRRPVHARASSALLQDAQRQAPQAELSSAASRRRRSHHFQIPLKARRLRRVVQALDFLEQDMDSVRRRITWLDRLNDWTNGKIDNPTVPELKRGRQPQAEKPASDASEASGAGEELHVTVGPVASLKHLQRQLETINGELADFEALLPALEGNAQETRKYYLRKLARVNMTDSW